MDASNWDERYAAEDLVWSLAPNAVVVAELTDLPPGRALDLAAGEGRNALWLAERGFDVEAVEFSPVAIAKAGQLAAHRDLELTFTLADLTAPLTLDTADLVLIAYLHLPREVEAEVLRRAAAWVAPGGTLLLVAHARRNLTEGVGGPQDPNLLPTPTEVIDALAGTGLELERADEVLREVAGEPNPAIDIVMRAHRPR